MAATIAALDKNPARLRLLVSSDGGYWLTHITRADESGTHTVRAEAGVFPTAPNASAFLVSDYEYPLTYGASYSYTVYATNGVATATATVQIGPAHALANVERGLLHLTVPQRPASGIQLNNGIGADGGVIVRWEDGRETRNTVHTVIGREDPIVVMHPAASRVGEMDISCPDLFTAQVVEKTLAQPLVFQLRQSDQWTLAVYFVATSTRLTHSEDNWTTAGPTTGQPERRWTVVVGVQEVAWPTGYVVPITVWTYNDVAASYGDYNAVAGSFATYADLLERQEIP